ncbi:MAG: metal-dependent transcriptional regulator [Candidatus Caldarchaeum sp.]|nr:metal-dependent transcriptional regulator [Candidatus Caldarchaeum sp.]
MPKININEVEKQYLQHIYRSLEDSVEVSTGSLADAFKVRPASAVDVLNRLAARGLIKRTGWGRFSLSQRGMKLASRIIHNHRVLETYFSRNLGLTEAEACREASKIDHLVGDAVVRQFCKILGHPSKCIHGRDMVHTSCLG